MDIFKSQQLKQLSRALLSGLLASSLLATVAWSQEASQQEQEQSTSGSSSELDPAIESVGSEVNRTAESVENTLNNTVEDVNSEVEPIQQDIEQAIEQINSQIDAVRGPIDDAFSSLGDVYDSIHGTFDDLFGSFDDLLNFGGGSAGSGSGGSGSPGNGSGSSNSQPGLLGEIPIFFRDLSGWIQPDPSTGSRTAGRDAIAERIEGAAGAVNLPDLKFLKRQIMEDVTGSPGQQLSETLETGGEQISYVNRDDYNQQAERKATRGIAYGSAISGEAQQKMKERQEKSQENTQKAVGVVQQSAQTAQESQSLAEESQGLDVTQQILQNISAQEGLQSQQLAMLSEQKGRVAVTLQAQLEEQYQGRIDRAYENVLNAQIARELSGSNTASRRSNIAVSNLSTQQIGAMMLPGNRAIMSDHSEVKAGNSVFAP